MEIRAKTFGIPSFKLKESNTELKWIYIFFRRIEVIWKFLYSTWETWVTLTSTFSLEHSYVNESIRNTAKQVRRMYRLDLDRRKPETQPTRIYRMRLKWNVQCTSIFGILFNFQAIQHSSTVIYHILSTGYWIHLVHICFRITNTCRLWKIFGMSSNLAVYLMKLNASKINLLATCQTNVHFILLATVGFAICNTHTHTHKICNQLLFNA